MITGAIPEIEGKRKRSSQLQDDNGPTQSGCFSMCLGPKTESPKKKVKLNKKQQIQARW